MDFFRSLDDTGKALFMLGGPVDGRTPEPRVYAINKEYVREAYKTRSEVLNEQAEKPLVVDLTGGKGKEKVSSTPKIDSLFIPVPSFPILQHLGTDQDTRRGTQTHARDGPERTRREHVRAHARSPRMDGDAVAEHEGSGLNGLRAEGSS